MADQPLYKPFDKFDFSSNICFLTGAEAVSTLAVFPDWMRERFDLNNKPFRTLDERIVTYNDLRVPVSALAVRKIEILEDEIKQAFEEGYERVKTINSLKLFQWIALRVYGIIHYEINAGLRDQQLRGEAFNFSQGLMHKFGNLHLMLQSLLIPIEFEGVCPWSFTICKIDNPELGFVYRDEINTLIYSIRMADFGIIASLQDNGENVHYHRDLLTEIEGRELNLQQFEEVCARFYYSAYLFNRLPEYSVIVTPETVYVEPMPLHMQARPVFDIWQNKTYAQVLENFWKPWNLSLFEILKDPDEPMSVI